MSVQSKVEGSDTRTAEASPIALPVIVLLLSMGACAMILPEEPPMPVAQCHVEGARWVIGRDPSSDVVEGARVDSGSARVRVIRPGDVVTMDVRGDRLNLNVNARNAIEGMKCG